MVNNDAIKASTPARIPTHSYVFPCSVWAIVMLHAIQRNAHHMNIVRKEVSLLVIHLSILKRVILTIVLGFFATVLYRYILMMKASRGMAMKATITRFEIELTKRVVVGSEKNICTENVLPKSLLIWKFRLYMRLVPKIPKNLPAINRIAGAIDILSALFSSLDIILGEFV